MSGRSEKEAHVHVLNAILDYAVKVEDFSLRDSILGQMSDMGVDLEPCHLSEVASRRRLPSCNPSTTTTQWSVRLPPLDL